jgi:branched-chain amino acid transport system substrate-binding protein
MRKTRWVAVGAGVLATTLILAGCGGSAADADADDKGGWDTSDAPAATGEPIIVGYINQEGGAAGSFPEMTAGTEAAVEYVNKRLGGINNRPIQLEKCIVDGTPESSQACANEVVQKDAVAVISGLNFSGPSVYEIVHAAGLPYVIQAPTQGSDFDGDGVFSLIGSSPVQFAGEAKFIASQGYKKVTLIGNETPSGHAGVDILTAALAAEGITDVKAVFEAPTATDFTAVLTQADEGDPDFIANMFVAPGCATMVATAASLGVDAQFGQTTGCSNPSLIEAMGAGAEGQAFIAEMLPITPNQDDPDVADFIAAMDNYAGIPMEELAAFHQHGFGVTVTALQAMARAGDTIDGASITAALSEPGPWPAFMDSDYNCDGTAIEGFPAVCNATVRIQTVEDGELKELTEDWL